ncbi:ThuA domain-containing protein [Tundrisphaera lichenicola]|uniref:ThuA domain-containing protein n=1 Tax=Tundrisphaera lichenicola TaxID=2029860 RepID=UPI003EB904AE
MRRWILPIVVLAGASTIPARADEPSKPVKLLIITGNTHSAHDWKTTTPALDEVLSKGGKIDVDVTTTPATDLTDENLAKYDVLLLNYYDFKTAEAKPETNWSESNKAALLKAVHDGGKGLVLIHHASGAFTKPNWVEFEKAVGGWRTQGFHGPAHDFTVKRSDSPHPISEGAPAEFAHVTDELYQNCLVPPGSVVLATAYSDPSKPKGTGKDEVVIWASTYGKGRIFENVLGHDAATIQDPGFQTWTRRGVIWAATGKVPSDLK